jgi:signal peptidase
MLFNLLMNRDTKDVLIVIGVIAVLFASTIGGVFLYSGMSNPYTVVESKSMQHSNDTSYIGIIDTGDMIIMRDPSKTSITTYIEGRQNGYSMFGDYGDVIIYYRGEGQNPVIHRAILYLEYLGGEKWKASALENYDTELWTVANGTWDNMWGNLTLYGLRDGELRTSATINLTVLAQNYPHSGYLTKGDNNNIFDQPNAITKGLVQTSSIKAVAGLELPWLGCIKLISKNINVSQIPQNSVPCLAILFIDIIFFFIVLGVILECLFVYIDERREKIKDIPKPPTP